MAVTYAGAIETGIPSVNYGIVLFVFVVVVGVVVWWIRRDD